MKNDIEMISFVSARAPLCVCVCVCCSERWEKIVVGFHDNGTVTYHPTKKFFFNRALSRGDEDDIVQTLNIPLMVRSLARLGISVSIVGMNS